MTDGCQKEKFQEGWSRQLQVSKEFLIYEYNKDRICHRRGRCVYIYLEKVNWQVLMLSCNITSPEAWSGTESDKPFYGLSHKNEK